MNSITYGLSSMAMVMIVIFVLIASENLLNSIERKDRRLLNISKSDLLGT